MKTITIKQPWASLIVEGIKDVENRSWKTNFRGRVLVHAGLDKRLTTLSPTSLMTTSQVNALMNSDVNYSLNDFKFRQLGAIIGSVEIVDCVKRYDSVWADQIGWKWVLANPIKFDEPVGNVKGKLSFWDYNRCPICNGDLDYTYNAFCYNKCKF